MGRLHGCWSHQYPSLFIPHRKRCKGGIAPACCRLHLMLHPLRAQWVPSRGPLGGWRSRRFRGPGPFSERWPRWVGRVFSLVFPNPLRIDHVAFPTSAAAAAPVLRSLLPLVPPGGLGGGSVHPCAPRTPLHSTVTPLSPSPSRHSPASDPFSNLRLSPRVPDSGLAAGISCCPLHVPPTGPEAAWAPLLRGGGWGHFMAWSDSLPCHPFPCEQHRVTSECGGGTAS